MKSGDFLCLFACLLFISLLTLPQAKANEGNQMTKLSFSQPVKIPGEVLPAGTYWFVVASDEDRDLVRVYAADWSRECAVLLTIPIQRKELSNVTELKFAERSQHQPEALLDWYYPGHRTGHEFVYSNSSKREFVRDAKRDVEVIKLISRP